MFDILVGGVMLGCMDIKVHEILDYLPEARAAEIGLAVGRIVRLEGVLVVVLFGSYARGDYRVERGAEGRRKSDYDLLVVVGEYDDRDRVRGGLTSAFDDIEVHVQVLVEPIGLINRALREKQYFYTDIKREGKVLFDRGEVEFAEAVELSATRRREIAEEDYKYWASQFEVSFKYGKIATKEGDLRKASFELQQCVEHCYTAVEMVFSHYNPHEHNLSILRGGILVYDQGFGEILSCDTKEKEKLFVDLNFAYIGGRYRSEEEFPVCLEQLNYWRSEAEKLMLLTREVCEERIAGFRVLEG